MNTQEVFREPTNPNHLVALNNIASNADKIGSEFLPLQRCEGDCNNDDDCVHGLFCMQKDKRESVPGCSGTQMSKWDYCVDINDFGYGFTLLPTGSWVNNWHYSAPLKVDLTGE